MADEVPDSAVVPTALAYTLGGDPGVRNPELAEKYRSEYKTRGEKFALDYEDVMSKRQAEVENAKRILDETAAALRAGHTGEGPGQMNLPLLQMAAGFFKPTKSGNFGEEFGNALSGLAGGIGNQRMRDDEFNRGMADLTLKRSSFEQEPLKDRAALLKAQQLQQEKGQQAIETAQIKTGGAGAGAGTSAEYKTYLAVKNASPDPSKFLDFDTWRARRAGEQEYQKISAREAAEAKANLPQLEAQAEQFRSQIDRILDPANRRYLEGLIGAVDGIIPNWMRTDPKSQDMISALSTLEAMTFGQSVAAMKGLGALSNMEGQKIDKIMGDLKNKRGSLPVYIANLERMRDSTSRIGAEVGKKKSEWGMSSPDAPGAPALAPAPGGAPAPTAGGLVQGADGVYRLSPGGR